MPIPLILGAAAAAPALFNVITGLSQKNKARKALAEYESQQSNRPEYQTPEEAYRILAMAQQSYADPNMPGQGAALDRTSQSFSNVVSAGSQAGNPFAALVGAQAQADASNIDIATQAAGYQDQQRDRLTGALQMIGGYKDQEFQMNEFAPWADKTQMALNQYRDYRQAGNQNLKSGLEGISGIAMSMLAPGLGGSMQAPGPNMTGLQSIYQRYTGNQPQNNTPPAPY